MRRDGVQAFIRYFSFFFQEEDGIRDADVTGVQTCALPISDGHGPALPRQVGEVPLVAAVHARGRRPTVRAGDGGEAGSGDDGDPVRLGQDLLDDEPAGDQREEALGHSELKAGERFPSCAHRPPLGLPPSRNPRGDPKSPHWRWARPPCWWHSSARPCWAKRWAGSRPWRSWRSRWGWCSWRAR